jgi:hypothetical protein
MKRPHLLTPVVLGIALVCMATFSEAQSKIIHVTATVVQLNVLGGQDVLGDSNIANADLADPDGDPAGTLAAHCTIFSVPPRDTLEQCLLTAVFPSGQILFGGVAELAVPGASAEFGILGGTGRFSKAQGVVHGLVNPSGTIDFIFTLD